MLCTSVCAVFCVCDHCDCGGGGRLLPGGAQFSSARRPRLIASDLRTCAFLSRTTGWQSASTVKSSSSSIAALLLCSKSSSKSRSSSVLFPFASTHSRLRLALLSRAAEPELSAAGRAGWNRETGTRHPRPPSPSLLHRSSLLHSDRRSAHSPPNRPNSQNNMPQTTQTTPTQQEQQDQPREQS